MNFPVCGVKFHPSLFPECGDGNLIEELVIVRDWVCKSIGQANNWISQKEEREAVVSANHGEPGSDNHIIFPYLYLDPAATSWPTRTRPLKDYVSSLSTKPMDHSRPLWESHVLDFPTVAIPMHHSLGDGVSLLSLLIACTRSAADPARLPELPPLFC
ncbi:hypothetical protein ACP70R_001945 [Stipagrostis hirtigluma subsp. patula]